MANVIEHTFDLEVFKKLLLDSSGLKSEWEINFLKSLNNKMNVTVANDLIYISIKQKKYSQ